MNAAPTLPSVLPSAPAFQDTTTTLDEINGGVGKVTDATETRIYICTMDDCNRLYPSRDRLMLHRKRDHNSENEEDILTWNE